MKKILLITILFFICIFSINAIEINSKNAILYNLNDNSIIYEKNSEEKVQIASLTKIVTAITVLENVEDLNSEVLITYPMLRGLDGYVKVGLQVGNRVTYIDLLYALMLPSAADAAQALAISVGSSIDGFSSLMNSEVEKIGVSNTHFDNPVGMDSDNNYSTALDLSKILIYCLKNDTFKTIFNTNTYEMNSINKKIEKTLIKSGKEYNVDTSIITGAKTGFTYGAGLCLASTTTLEDVNYLLITLGADINYIYNITDSVNIYNYYSTNYGYVYILNKNDLLKTIKVKDSKTKFYDIYSKDDISLYLEKVINKDNINYEYNGIEVLTKEIKKGDKLGEVKILYKDRLLYTYDVYLDLDIKYYNYPLYIGIGVSILVVMVFTIIIIKKKLKKH